MLFMIRWYPKVTLFSGGENHGGHNDEDKEEFNATYATSNIARAHFFFSRDTFIKHERNELFGWLDFVSNIGGLMGLTMGVSLLSVVEVFYFFGFKWACSKQQRKEK